MPRALPVAKRASRNWELSANRANASRREMVVGGMDECKVLRVVGLASTVLFDKNDPLNPVNRRISIVVLNKKTEDAFLNETSEDVTEVENASQGGDVLTPADEKGMTKG